MNLMDRRAALRERIPSTYGPPGSRASRNGARQALTLEGAKTVAAAAAAEAKLGMEGGSIALVDDGGSVVYLERIRTTFPMGAHIALEKARTAALFQRSS